MAVYEENFAIRAAVLNPSSFTDVPAPIDCITVVVLNNSAVDVALRSDPGNADSEVTVAAGQQFEIGGARPTSGHQPVRFRAGSVVCSLKAASGTPSIPVIATK